MKKLRQCLETPTPTLNMVSYGGGVQSTALLVLAAQRKLDITTFVHANVGDDSENPATVRYLREIAIPYAEAHGITIHIVQRVKRGGIPVTLLGELTAPTNKAELIPVRLGTGMPASRVCTSKFKIEVLAKWIKQQLGVSPSNPARVHLGISINEMQRMRTQSGYDFYTVAYPLIDLRMNRNDCVRVIEMAGLPIPEKSACWFCPFTSLTKWSRMADTNPDQFARAVQLERDINTHIRQPKGKDAIYFTDALRPLDVAVGSMSQGNLWQSTTEDATCDSGYCFL